MKKEKDRTGYILNNLIVLLFEKKIITSAEIEDIFR